MTRITKHNLWYFFLVFILLLIFGTVSLFRSESKTGSTEHLFYHCKSINNRNSVKNSPCNIEYRIIQLSTATKFREAFNYCNKKENVLTDTKFATMINYYRGVIMYKMDSAQLAIPYFKSCIDSLNKTELEVTASIYHYLGNVYKKLSNYSTAMEYYRKSLTLNEALGKKMAKTKTLTNMGNLFAREKKNDSARLYYSTSLHYYLKEKDSIRAARIYNNLGNIAYQSSAYIEAIDYYMQSIKIKENARDLKGLAKSYNNLANIYHFILNNNDKAMLYYQKSLNLNRPLNKHLEMAGTINNIGNVYVHINEYDTAICKFYEALEIYESLDNQEGVGETFENIGITYNKCNKRDQALYYLRKSESVRQNINTEEQLGNVYNSLGSNYFYNSKYDSAIIEYERAFAVAQKTNDKLLKKKILLGLATTYATIGEFKKAYNLELEYLTCAKSLLNKDISSQVIRMQEEYETEKKQQQINLQNIEIKNKTTQRNRLIIVLGIIFTLSAVIIRLMILKRRTDRISYQKDIALKKIEIGNIMQESDYKSLKAMVEGQDTERRKISRDLHDRVGNSLTLLKLKMSSETPSPSSSIRINENIKLLNSIYTEIRNISHELGLNYISKFGLDSALKEMVHTIESSGKISITLNILGDPQRLKSDWEIEIFRIIQELVTNVLKHANAHNLDIQLHYDLPEKTLSVTVEDDGKGFQPDFVNKGIGFSNIEYRIQNISGTFEISSKLGSGSCIAIIAGYPAANNATIKTNNYD